MKSPFLRAARDLFFPRRCPFCNRVIGYLPECPECLPQMNQWLHKPARLSSEEHKLQDLEGAASLYLYEGTVANAILLMKFEERPWYAREFGYEMAQRLLSCTFKVRHGIISMENEGISLSAYDCVVPIPSSHARRGYNCAALIAQELAEALAIPFYPSALQKQRVTAAQSTLHAAQRLTNVVNSMKVNDGSQLEGKRVLLVDDVITTGATISEGARALLQAGALSVYGISAAASEIKKN